MYPLIYAPPPPTLINPFTILTIRFQQNLKGFQSPFVYVTYTMPDGNIGTITAPYQQWQGWLNTLKAAAALQGKSVVAITDSDLNAILTIGDPPVLPATGDIIGKVAGVNMDNSNTLAAGSSNGSLTNNHTIHFTNYPLNVPVQVHFLVPFVAHNVGLATSRAFNFSDDYDIVGIGCNCYPVQWNDAGAGKWGVTVDIVPFGVGPYSFNVVLAGHLQQVTPFCNWTGGVAPSGINTIYNSPLVSTVGLRKANAAAGGVADEIFCIDRRSINIMSLAYSTGIANPLAAGYDVLLRKAGVPYTSVLVSSGDTFDISALDGFADFDEIEYIDHPR